MIFVVNKKERREKWKSKNKKSKKARENKICREKKKVYNNAANGKLEK